MLLALLIAKSWSPVSHSEGQLGKKAEHRTGKKTRRRKYQQIPTTLPPSLSRASLSFSQSTKPLRWPLWAFLAPNRRDRSLALLLLSIVLYGNHLFLGLYSGASEPGAPQKFMTQWPGHRRQISPFNLLTWRWVELQESIRRCWSYPNWRTAEKSKTGLMLERAEQFSRRGPHLFECR